jgi:3-oxoacyl-[acyl-carrier-protein] synthase-3
MYASIAGTGSYLPEKVLTNHDLAKTVDTSDEWIVTRTGIRQRHIAAEGQMASDLALEASKNALAAAGIGADQLGLLIVATTTPDMIFPSTACILQAKLGVRDFPAFDVQAVCSGFVYGLTIADLFMRSGQCRYALVVGTEIYSRILDWSDRGTCVLFGDGAGAVVLAASERPGIMETTPVFFPCLDRYAAAVCAANPSLRWKATQYSSSPCAFSTKWFRKCYVTMILTRAPSTG